jgi:homoserine kinase
VRTRQRAAQAEAVAAPAVAVEPAGASAVAVEPANALVEATVRRFARELEPAGLGTTVRWRTSIPQRVGLGSSSALVIAVTRALCQLHSVSLAPAERG